MSEKVKVPTVGESIEEVTLSSWRKKDGEYVDMDEVIAELESDKATFELTAPQSGMLKIIKQEGDTVPVGEVVCEIEDASAKQKTSKKPASTDVASPVAEVKEMRVPEVGESISEVTISGWRKKDGDSVALDETIAEVESDKATFELPAEGRGILEIVAQEGETLPIGGVICRIKLTKDSPTQPSTSPPPSAPVPVSSQKDGRVPSYAKGYPSPAARKILDEKGISPSDVSGTGVSGRITKEDAVLSQPTSSKQQAVSTPRTSVGEDSRGERREKLSSLRKTIARRLLSAKNETAMLTTFNEVNMKAIMDVRARYKETFKEKYGVGLGFMSFFTKAVCVALKSFPAVNAYFDGGDVVYHDYCDISIAVSTPKGLVVPVIRNAELLTMHEIEKEIIYLATRGREGKLSIEEMTGGTFSVTNGGIFGSMLSTPILNPPQSAILGMHNIVQRPMAVGKEVVVLPIMYVALSYDHRVIDGKESVSFLVRVKEMLEDPNRLMLDV